MAKLIIILLFSIEVYASSWAGETNIINAASPKLRRFVNNHPAALRALTNVLSEAFAKRSVQLYYFYSDDESIPRASHYYPDDSVVGVLIRENQEPLDEYICLVYESLNSTSEKHFQELFSKVESGTITKSSFLREVTLLEFNAVKRTRALLKALSFDKDETLKSDYYNLFLDCPDEFEKFLTYGKKTSITSDPMKYYEMQYDALRKK